MTIHTNTFPLVLQQAANTPCLYIELRKESGVLMPYLCRTQSLGAPCEEGFGVNIAGLLTSNQIAKLALLPQPVKINLIDNASFKHMLECISPREPVLV